MRFVRLGVISLLGLALLAACDVRADRSSSDDDESAERDSRPEREKKKKKKKKGSASASAAPAVSATAGVPPAPRPVVPPAEPARPPGPSAVPKLEPAPTIPPRVEPPAQAEDRPKIRRWVAEVALGTEFAGPSGSRSGLCARFAKPIRVSVMKGDQAVRKDLLLLVPTLHELLSPAGGSIRMVADLDASAELKVYFAKASELDGIASTNGFRYVSGNDGFFYTFWNDRYEIQRAFVLLATDKLSAQELKHFTYEEVTQALGLSNDSALFSESVFFAKGSDGGTAQDLSALDRKLVRFFYAHVGAGDDRTKLLAAFDAHWR